jgi:hypothetical protein
MQYLIDPIDPLFKQEFPRHGKKPGAFVKKRTSGAVGGFSRPPVWFVLTVTTTLLRWESRSLPRSFGLAGTPSA